MMDWKKRLAEIKPALPTGAALDRPPFRTSSGTAEVPGSGSRPEKPAESGISRLIVEDAGQSLPDYFVGTKGAEVLDEVKRWLASIIPGQLTPSLDPRILEGMPAALEMRARYFTGRHEAQRFERVFREHVITRLKFAVGRPDEVSEYREYIAPENRGNCIILVAGFYAGDQPVLFRTFTIRNDGKVMKLRDIG